MLQGLVDRVRGGYYAFVAMRAKTSYRAAPPVTARAGAANPATATYRRTVAPERQKPPSGGLAEAVELLEKCLTDSASSLPPVVQRPRNALESEISGIRGQLDRIVVEVQRRELQRRGIAVSRALRWERIVSQLGFQASLDALVAIDALIRASASFFSQQDVDRTRVQAVFRRLIAHGWLRGL